MDGGGGRHASDIAPLLLQLSLWEECFPSSRPQSWILHIPATPLFWLSHVLYSFMTPLIRSALQNEWTGPTAYIITIKLITCQSYLVMIKKKGDNFVFHPYSFGNDSLSLTFPNKSSPVIQNSQGDQVMIYNILKKHVRGRNRMYVGLTMCYMTQAPLHYD